MGRDAMGTMANTLIMVFVGSSFNKQGKAKKINLWVSVNRKSYKFNNFSHYLYSVWIQCKNKYSLGGVMKGYIEERAVDIANYIIKNNATVRQTAKQFGVSKSTVHMDVTK